MTSQPTTTETHHDSRIAKISLLEWLRADDRPTIVFGKDDRVDVAGGEAVPSQWSLSYTNPAALTFMNSVRQPKASANNDYTALLREIELAVNDRFDFAGHHWRIRYFLDELRVVFCEDELHEVFARSPSVNEPGDFTFPVTAKENLSPQRHTSDESVTRSISSSSSGSTPRLRLRPLSSQSPILEKEIMDWTRFDMPNISQFVRMFRDYDWASTALGSIKDWPIELRQTIVKMMVNPGRSLRSTYVQSKLSFTRRPARRLLGRLLHVYL